MEERRRYPFWLTLLILGMLGLSAATMYLLWGGTSAVSVGEVFGTPVPVRTGVAPGTGSIRPADAPAMREGHIPDSVRALARSGARLTTEPRAAARPQPGPPRAVPEPQPQRPAQPAPPPRDVALDSARAAVGRSDWATALAAYQRLIQERPDSRVVALERARVLAWAGQPAAGAAALEPLIRQDRTDRSLQLEQARWLWWAGRLWRADSAVTAVLAADTANLEARSLQVQIREGLTPSSARAQQWLDQRDAPLERLWLARALAREHQHAAALPHYRVAAASNLFPDSVLLEFASEAVTADSPRAAVAALERYTTRHPEDRDVAVRYARALAWAGMNQKAVALYGSLLASRDDPQLRYERAMVYVAENRLEPATRDLSLVVAEEPRMVPALMLQGDIARWEGQWQAALNSYRRVQGIAPTTEGLTSGVQEAERMLALAQAAPDTLRQGGGSWSVETEAFGDSEDFRWLQAAAHRSWVFNGYALELRLLQDVARGSEATGLGPRTAGYGAEGGTQVAVGSHVWLLGSVGFRAFTDVGSFATWTAGLRWFDLKASRLLIQYQHGPAVRRAATAAALQAEVRSDLVSTTAERRLGDGTVSATLEYERLGSELGITHRYGGSVRVERSLASGIYGSLGMSGLTATGANPALPDYGNLYWTPRYYLAPTVGLRLETRLAPRWVADVRLNPSYVFVKERAGTEHRFFSDQLLFLGSGVDLTYAQPGWQIALSADWSGPVFARGYRAGALRLRFVTLPDWP